MVLVAVTVTTVVAEAIKSIASIIVRIRHTHTNIHISLLVVSAFSKP